MEPDDEDFTEDVYTFVCDYRELKDSKVICGITWHCVAAVEIDYTVEDDDYTIVDYTFDLTAYSLDTDEDPPEEALVQWAKAFDPNTYMDDIIGNH
jgi:hypothetical protein